MRCLVLLVALVALYSAEARTCEATGDPHFQGMMAHKKFFDDYTPGWKRFYELDGYRVATFQKETRSWGVHRTIQKVQITNGRKGTIKFSTSSNPTCAVHVLSDNDNGLSVNSWSNGFIVTGAGVTIRMNAACSGDGSYYTNIYLEDSKTTRGRGQCFNRGNDMPPTPKHCKMNIKRSRRACRKVSCHREIYASCVDDVCASGRTSSIVASLKRFNEERPGRPCQNGQNFALAGNGGRAIQVSTYPGGDAVNAIDGNNDGNWNSHSVSHTLNQGPGDWWQVKLPKTIRVTRVVVWSRTDCCMERLNNHFVELYKGDDGVDRKFVGNNGRVTATLFDKKRANRVGVRLQGQNYLSLAEVEVYGTQETADKNVALADNGGSATQSSTYGGGDANRAIDGNVDGMWGSNSVTHTNPEKAWWQVKLKKTVKVRRVAVWNRVDCCQERLQDYYVELYRNNKKVKSVHSRENGRVKVFKFRGVKANAVAIRLGGSNYLSLAEVQVWARARRGGGGGGGGGKGKPGRHEKKCRRVCDDTIYLECTHSAECANTLTGLNYLTVCKKRRGACYKECRKCNRPVRRCIRRCRASKKKCDVVRKCAAGVVSLDTICTERQRKCIRVCTKNPPNCKVGKGHRRHRNNIQQ